MVQRFCLKNVTSEELWGIAKSAIELVERLQYHLAPQLGFCSGPGVAELTDLALSLERKMNPEKLAFGDPSRIAVRPQNQPANVWSDLRDIRAHFDYVLTSCGWRCLCDERTSLWKYMPLPENGTISWPTKPFNPQGDEVQRMEAAAQHLLTFVKSSNSAIQTRSSPVLPVTNDSEVIMSPPDPLTRAMPAEHISAVRNFVIPFP